ncbi:MAG: hypothetical protein JWN45_1728, partial [Acidobacteriaceae bacterium]|nr:hypothetical protein [Acidobacteriaceae bacterium]
MTISVSSRILEIAEGLPTIHQRNPLPRIRPVLRPLAVCAKHLILSPERRLHGVAQPEYSPQTQ